MNKFIQKVSIAALSVLPMAALAVEPVKPIQGNTTIVDTIANVTTWVLSIGTALSVLFLIIGGIRYIISAGNPDQIEAARHTIFNAIIGIVVMVLAIIIVNTVVTAL